MTLAKMSPSTNRRVDTAQEPAAPPPYRARGLEIGASGFIGRHLVDHVLAEGASDHTTETAQTDLRAGIERRRVPAAGAHSTSSFSPRWSA